MEPIQQNSQKNLNIPEIDKSKAWRYFDGACQGNPGICGVGGIIFTRDNHVVAFKAAVGVGTNNKAKMFALWLMLKIVVERDITCLWITGDSNLIVEWANGNYRSEILLIAPIMDRIRERKAQFEFISFQHVYWELNMKADLISKEALNMQEGEMKFEEEVEACSSRNKSLYIFLETDG